MTECQRERDADGLGQRGRPAEHPGHVERDVHGPPEHARTAIGLGAQPPIPELGAMASDGRNYLFFETPDNYLVSLDAKTGKERWHVEIADFNQRYLHLEPQLSGKASR